MRIEIEETGSKGRYLMRDEDGATAGQMTFSKAGPNLIIIDHTEVSDDYRGRGLAADLVARGVEDARASGKKVVPLCPFARGQFQRRPEWRDVLSS